ncbi:MAG: FMN-binding protein [Clostridia bacterium]|nr:FMN-binding protein [Clostridia bacterium]
MTDNTETRVKTKKAVRMRLAQLTRHILQTAAFLLFPGLFLTVYNALRDVYRAILGGTFSLASEGRALLILLIVLGVSALWGRFFCGYLCSFGAAQELIYTIPRRLLGSKKRIPAKADAALKWVKYAVFACIVLFVWTLELPVDSSLSPWGVFGMLVSGNAAMMKAAFPTIGFVLLVCILVGSFFVERLFCRYLCPLGALFTPLSKFRLYRIGKKQRGCTGCRVCTRQCPMGIEVHRGERVTSGECVDCMRCTELCRPAALRADPNPALAGSATAILMGGFLHVGTILPVTPAAAKTSEPAAYTEIEDIRPDGTSEVPAREETARGPYADGTRIGTGMGFRGEVRVEVTVENGWITDLSVLSYKDDGEFFRKAESSLLNTILSAESTDVSAVSGATYSSRGILEAAANALNLTDTLMLPTETEPAGTEASEPEAEEAFHWSIGEEASELEPQIEQPAAETEEPAVAWTAPEEPAADWTVPEEPVTDWNTTEEPSEWTSPDEQTWWTPSGDDAEEGTSWTPAEEQNWWTPAEEPVAEEPVETLSGAYADGVYTGYGNGFRGTTQVSVTVEGGQITDITVVSYADDSKYFNKASSGMISSILSAQGVNVSTVSGATYSSRGILEAVANALGLEYTAPAVSGAGTGRGGRGH